MGRKKPLILCALFGAISAGMVSSSSANEGVTYTYDALGRLKAVTTTGTVNNGQAYSWCYDDAGNRQAAQTSKTGALADCSGPPAPSISISNGADFEGSPILFQVTLSSSYSSNISVSYATANGTAGAYDFYATSGVVTFSPGQTSKSILVNTKTDVTWESSETFTVNLSNPTGGAVIADGQATGTILNQEYEPTCGQYMC